MISRTHIHHTLEVYNINLIIAAVAHCTSCEPADTPYGDIGLRPVKPVAGTGDSGGRLTPDTGTDDSGDPLTPVTGTTPDGSAGQPHSGGKGPGSTEPGTTNPGATDPGSTEPGATTPGATNPVATGPGTTQPGVTDPGATEPGAIIPDSRIGQEAPVSETIREEVPATESPVSGKEMTLKATYRPVRFRREDFVVIHHQYYCEESRQGFTNEALDARNQEAAAESYRQKYQIPAAGEIRDIREAHGLSTDAMATLLGISEATYRRYENGSIPQLSTARLIRLAESRANLEVLAELAGIDIGVPMDVLAE